ncbi:MAG: hypothetical protein WC609_01700 [Candidatus Paceibacterota bacterium]|jgi:hypothetical protein
MIEIGNYKKITSDRNLFNQVVYTPLSDAVRLLNERQKDPVLMARVKKLLNGNIPEVFREKKCAIMARQLATPNYENIRFINLANEVGLHPVFLEYFDDKFTSVNKYKHSLGKLHIQNKIDKNGDRCVEKISIIDFGKADGKKLREIKTLWGEPLVDFHKKLFELHKLKDFSFFEETDWYKKGNEKPIEFYVRFFLLVTCFGILFENFLLLKEGIEGEFTRDVVLPALEKVINLTGVKPLIVPIESMDLETADFWYYHSPVIKSSIKNYLK